MAITAYGPMEITTKQAGQPRKPWSPSSREKAIKTTTQRGDTLLADGYTVEAYPDRPGVYAVYQPEGKEIKKGEACWYDCDIINMECDCRMFEYGGTCRHLIGVLKLVAEALRLVLPMVPAPAVAVIPAANFATASGPAADRRPLAHAGH